MFLRQITLTIALSLSQLFTVTAMAANPELSNMQPTREMEREAKNNPNGWVYVIDGNYGPNDAVPPEAIAGAWKVDATGIIVPGSFQANPKYKAKQK